ncbi:glycosyltransferase [Actinoallomurus iriomotensis]|uniref:GDP-mannose-dependent alpha-(1-6)-phosphatidylinositol dimannoside mannosyltransferase n=1 Tax=Actinoallomurus iriomotensis TaxID=478107 RepID=A0A9W6S1A5_9ACTN|nr:glycosyltransferase [Actinoallomurus iriomotensis]GLY85363.1 GDP-mannose-dependent alpha-(1-6)-phosphatidylinositol dimannoside mannosyltransferase [Actinoallomurus iriomotensis]
MQVANFYAPTSGGLRVALDETGRGFGRHGHERILIVPGRTGSVEQTPSGQRVTVRGLSLPGLGNYRVLTGRRRVRRLLDARPPDVLEVSDKTSLLWLARWSRRRGVPLVLFSHERLDAILYSRVPRWFPLRAATDTVNRRLARLADEVIVTSGFSRAEFDRVGARNVRRIPLGVDLETFRPVSHASAGDRPVRLVTVTRLSREKRPERAIDCLRVLGERGTAAELTVIGDGPDAERLRRRARGLPVTFLGHLGDRRAVAGRVASADVALFPSPAETFGLATLEALACGTPVVVPAAGAARELLGGPGSGVVSDETPAGMADAVRDLLEVPERLRRAAARAAAERYPWTDTVAALVHRYETIGSRSARR